MISGANFSLKEGRSKSLGSRKEISSERRDAWLKKAIESLKEKCKRSELQQGDLISHALF